MRVERVDLFTLAMADGRKIKQQRTDTTTAANSSHGYKKNKAYLEDDEKKYIYMYTYKIGIVGRVDRGYH